MTAEAYQASRARLRELSFEECKLLVSELKGLMALKKNGRSASTENEVEDVAGLVNSVMQAQGFAMLPREKLRGLCPDYNERCAKLWAFARTAMPYGRRPEHMALLRLGIRMLCQNLQQLGIPVTHAVVMRQLERLPAIIDAGFPGYAKVGLLGLVVRDRTHA